MGSKLSKTTNSNPLRTTNHEPRRAPDESGLCSACEDCEFSTAAVGAGEMVFTCDRKKLGHRFIVKGGDYCEKFVLARELVPAHLVRALAEGAKLIPLTQGKFAIVDADDYDELSRYKWHVNKGGRTYYASSQKKGKAIKMHRLIAGAPKGLFVDHINHNGLDNRKRNLRLCTRLENIRNQLPRRGGSSQYKGVCWRKREKKFVATICVDGKKLYLGYFDDEIEAAKAYDKKAKELFGQFAYLNFPGA